MKKSVIFGLMAAFVFSVAFGSIAYAENFATSTPSRPEKSAKPEKKSTLDSACMVKAVEKRENTVISAHDTLSGAVKTALTKRKTALMSAWGLTVAKDRRTARLAAWNAFRTEQKATRKAHLTAVKDAWKLYKTEAKACKVDTNGVEPEGLDISVSAAASNSANKQ